MASEVDDVVKSLLSGELNQKHLFFTLLAEKLIVQNTFIFLWTVTWSLLKYCQMLNTKPSLKTPFILEKITNFY